MTFGTLASSTVPAMVVARRNKTQFALASVDPRVTAIERQRRDKGLSHTKLLAAAGVHPSTWFFLRRGEQAPRAGTLDRLEAAIGQAGRAVEPAALKNVILATVRVAETVIVSALDAGANGAGTTRAQSLPLVQALDPRCRRATALRRSRRRVLAVYLVAVELELGNAEIARALGCSRQNVKQLRDAVEALRDDARADEFLERCRRQLTGEPGEGS